jgi:hypothetical protein
MSGSHVRYYACVVVHLFGSSVTYAIPYTSFTLFILASSVGYPTLLKMSHPMPRWVVDCRNCLASFTHSEVGRDRQLKDYLSPTAPELQPAGEEMECPSWTKAIYTHKDLRYLLK